MASLFEAAATGNANLMKQYVSDGISVHSRDDNGATAVHYASANNQVQCLEYLIQEKVDFNTKDDSGYTPLHCACNQGHSYVTEILLSAGGDPNIQDKDGWTSLMVSASKGHLSCLTQLLQKGAFVNLSNKNGATPLYVACQNNHVDCAICLINSKADINLAATYGQKLFPLHIACQHEHVDLVRILLQMGADTFVLSANKDTPLHAASLKGNTTIVEELLNKGAKLEVRNKKGCTPLLNACKNNHLELAKLLINAGADINACDKYRNTSLHIVCQKHHIGILSELISRKANLESTNVKRETSLIIACKNSHTAMARKLIKAGAKVNAQDKGWCSGLFYYAAKGNMPGMKMLVNAGANLDMPGVTPMHGACHYNHLECVRYLINMGASVNMIATKLKQKPTALHQTCHKGHGLIVRTLVENGANIHMVDAYNDTPLHIASSQGHLDIVKYLVHKGAKLEEHGRWNCTPFLYACGIKHLELVQFFADVGADVNACDENGNNGLIWACSSVNNDLQITKELILRAVNLESSNSLGETPFIDACKKNCSAVAECLLKAGAKVNARDKKYFSGLFYIALNGNIEGLKVLIDAGADVDVNSVSPLHGACHYNHLDCVRYLISMGASVNLRAALLKQRPTALHQACHKGHGLIVRTLVENGAGIDMVDAYKDTPLHTASSQGHFDIVQYLVHEGAKLEEHGRWNCTPFLYACRNNHLEVVKFLADAGADINTRDEDGNSGLMWACSMNNDLEMTNELIIRGADKELSNLLGETPLIAACKRSHTVVASYLVATGGAVDTKDTYGCTSLFYCGLNGNLSTIKILTKFGASVNLVCVNGATALHVSCQNNYIDCAAYLLEQGAVVNIATNLPERYTPLHTACYKGHILIVRTLCEFRADVNVVDARNNTALHVASSQGHTAVVKELLHQKAQMEECGRYKCTPFLYACRNNHLEVVKFLADAGADINAHDEDGNCGLMWACSMNNDLEMTKELVRRGANMELRNLLGETPFIAACKKSCLDVATCLLSKNVDVNSQDDDGISGLLHFASMGNFPGIDALIQAGASVNLASKEGISTLHVTCENGYLNCVIYLLDNGAELNLRGSISNQTPLHLACQNGHSAIVRVLLERGADIHISNLHKETPIHIGSSQGYKAIVVELLHRGAKLEQQGRWACTPFLHACRSNHLEVAKILVGAGADVNKGDEDGNTALHYAVMTDNCEMLLFLQSQKYMNIYVNRQIESALSLARRLESHFMSSMLQVYVKYKGIETDYANMGTDEAFGLELKTQGTSKENRQRSTDQERNSKMEDKKLENLKTDLNMNENSLARAVVQEIKMVLGIMSEQIHQTGRQISQQMDGAKNDVIEKINTEAGDCTNLRVNCVHPTLKNHQEMLEQHMDVNRELLNKLFKFSLVSNDEQSKIDSQRSDLGKRKLLLWILEEKPQELIDENFVKALSECTSGPNRQIASKINQMGN